MSNTKDYNLNKMKLAHDYFMKHGDKLPVDFSVEQAWFYVDLMFEQFEKRNIKDLDVKDIGSCTSIVEGFTVNWDNLPEWAEWFAVDRDGCCYIYSYKPQTKDGYDYWGDFEDGDNGRAECIGSVEHVKDWKNTLIKRHSL